MKKTNIRKNITFIITLFIILISLGVIAQCTGNQGGEPPVANNVRISGNGEANTELTGKYTFSDPDEDDEEGESIYRWLISDDEEGEYTEISGANQITYTPTEEQVGKYIKFEVVPVSKTEPTNGEPVQSDPIMIVPEGSLTDTDITQEDGYKVVYVDGQDEFDQALQTYKDEEKIKFKLAEGEYEIDEAFNNVETHWIEGAGKDKVTLKGNLRYNNSEDIRITDLTFEHMENAGEQYCMAFDNSQNVRIDNVEVKDAVENGVQAIGSEVDVSNSEFNNNGASNIYYSDGSKGTISNITSNGAVTLDGVSVSESEVIVEDSTFNANNQSGVFYYNNSKGKIINCTSTGNKKLHGVEIKNSEVDIEGGTYSENGENGIQYVNSSGTIKNVTAKDNLKLQGIQLQNSNVNIEACITSGNNQSGVYILQNSTVNILNLTSFGNQINGVKVESSVVNITNDDSQGTRRTEGSGNIYDNLQSGITYWKNSSGIVNGVKSAENNSLYGIEVKNSQITIQNSQFIGNPLGGIRVYNNGSVEITDSEFNENGIDSDDPQGHGIVVENSQADIISSISNDNEGFGLLTTGSTISLSNVTFQNNGEGEVANIDGSSDITVVEN